MTKKIVLIKIGSGILMTNQDRLDQYTINHIARQVSAIQKLGYGVVLVVSGAVASGVNYFHNVQINKNTRGAIAGVGQAMVTSMFNTVFAKYSIVISQILLTKTELDFSSHQGFIKTLQIYIEKGIIPVINENDVLNLDTFECNDILAVKIATMIKAYSLVILSSRQGSKYGRGGGISKQKALAIAQENNINARIVDGKAKNIILKTLI